MMCTHAVMSSQHVLIFTVVLQRDYTVAPSRDMGDGSDDEAALVPGDEGEKKKSGDSSGGGGGGHGDHDNDSVCCKAGVI